MLESYLDLSWQFRILVLEAPFAVLAGLLICSFYPGRPRPAWWIPYALVWNTAVLLLFVFGGATSSWQHWLYIGWYLMDSAMAIKNRNKPFDDMSKLSGSATILAVFILTGIPLALLLTGL